MSFPTKPKAPEGFVPMDSVRPGAYLSAGRRRPCYSYSSGNLGGSSAGGQRAPRSALPPATGAIYFAKRQDLNQGGQGSVYSLTEHVLCHTAGHASDHSSAVILH